MRRFQKYNCNYLRQFLKKAEKFLVYGKVLSNLQDNILAVFWLVSFKKENIALIYQYPETQDFINVTEIFFKYHFLFKNTYCLNILSKGEYLQGWKLYIDKSASYGKTGKSPRSHVLIITNDFHPSVIATKNYVICALNPLRRATVYCFKVVASRKIISIKLTLLFFPQIGK